MEKSSVNLDFSNVSKIEGGIQLKGDKSISHRALFLSTLAENGAVLSNLPISEDITQTVNVIKQLGVIDYYKGKYVLFNRENEKIDCNIFVGESGTTYALFLGFLNNFCKSGSVEISKTLLKRNMNHIIEPLKEMGINFDKVNSGKLLFNASNCKGIDYFLNIPSAQLKSALIFATNKAQSETILRGRIDSRNHTEIILGNMTNNISISDNELHIRPNFQINSFTMEIPGDISSAFYFIIPALLLPNSELRINNVSLNETRIKHLQLLYNSGANIKIEKRGAVFGEDFGDIIVKYSYYISGLTIPEHLGGFLIDEYPALMIMAPFLKGKSCFELPSHLRNKESDRIKSVISNLQKWTNIEENGNKVCIEGLLSAGDSLTINTFDDHRVALSMLIFALLNKVKVKIDNIDCINKSFPDFFYILRKVVK